MIANVIITARTSVLAVKHVVPIALMAPRRVRVVANATNQVVPLIALEMASRRVRNGQIQIKKHAKITIWIVRRGLARNVYIMRMIKDAAMAESTAK